MTGRARPARALDAAIAMIMIEQSRRLSEPLRWGRRERAAVAVVLGCLVLAVIGLGAYALTSGAPARARLHRRDLREHAGRGAVHACGARRQGACAPRLAAFREIAQELRAACKRAGFPFARQPPS